LYGTEKWAVQRNIVDEKADSQHLSSNINTIILVPGSVTSKKPRKIASFSIDDLVRVFIPKAMEDLKQVQRLVCGSHRKRSSPTCAQACCEDF